MAERSEEIEYTVDVITLAESQSDLSTADDGDDNRSVESYDEFTTSRSIDELTGESDIGTESLPSVPGVISAGLCIGVVSEVCDRYGDQVQRSACARICFRTANPIAVGGCGAFCLAVVEVIDRYGCQRSGDFLCAALGFSV